MLCVETGLAALGGAAGYYYHKSTETVVKTQSPEETQKKSKQVDYNQVYKDIAALLDEDPE